MSSSHPPPDCALQLPSWDEFDQTEELDCSESDLVRDQRTADRSTTVGLTLPPGFDAGSSQLRETEERSSIPPDVRHSNQGVASSSFFDQLPNSLPQHFDDQPTSSNATHPLGPTLPPGFVLNSRTGEEDDPEDPGDPEDPDENDSRSKVPSLHCPGRTEQIGPTLPPGFGDFSPSLPDEVRPRSQGRSLSATMPPPEPEETRVSIWSSKPDVAVAASSSRTVIGPAVPDLLPTVSHFENAEEGEEEGEEVYGPAIPPDLDPAQRPSTSNARDDLEMPVDDDEHCVRDDDTSDDNDIIGPMPPCESAEAAEREFKQRLFAYEVQHAQKIPTAKREEWMVKLPKKLHSFGLGARVFSKSGNGILSDQEGSRQWTETPQEKDERLAGKPVAGPSNDDLHIARSAKNDATQERLAIQLNKERGVSLLDVHQRKRKLAAHQNESSGESGGRRPFDRERDMQVQGMRGEIGVAELKERCGQLSSRFGHSSSQKFL